MKILLFMLTILIAATFAWSQTNSLAQTNVAAQADTKAKNSRSRDIDAKSRHLYLTGDTRQIVYYDHVVITNAELRLTCERFTVNLPPQGLGDHPTNAVAETNVDITMIDDKGQTNHLVCDKGIYDYSVVSGITNAMLTFWGHVTNYTAYGWTTAEPLRYDIVTGGISGDNVETHGTLPPSGTNGSSFNLGR